MSTITVIWPDWLMPRTFRMYHEPHDVVHQGMYSRTTQVSELDVDVWRCTMEFAPAKRHMTAAQEAFIGMLRGRSNFIAMGDLRPERRVPRGTLRGNPTLSATHRKGVHVLSVQTVVGATLFAGDRVGVASQIFEVARDCIADKDGILAVETTQRTWSDYPQGAVVVWNRPFTRWRRIGSQPGISSGPAMTAEGWSIELEQHVDPAYIVAVAPSAPRIPGGSTAVTAPQTSGVTLNVGNTGFVI